MKRCRKGRRGFTLAELTMAVALLAFFSIFIVQMFAKADQLARKARNLDQAVVCAVNLAEMWKSVANTEVPAAILDLRQNRTAGKNDSIPLDSHFQICDASRAVYLAELTIQPVKGASAGIWELSIVIGRSGPSDSGPVYTLRARSYFREEAVAP